MLKRGESVMVLKLIVLIIVVALATFIGGYLGYKSAMKDKNEGDKK